jgi:hypothetical protein
MVSCCFPFVCVMLETSMKHCRHVDTYIHIYIYVCFEKNEDASADCFQPLYICIYMCVVVHGT